jgi:Histidinol phosphatase and related hydrolases of the PHP family
MTNEAIAHNFSLLSKLMDIHGENSFKAKAYSNAAFTIDKLPVELAELPEQKIAAIKGLGDSIAKKITEQIQTGQLFQLNELIAQTPAGIIEMLRIKGLGAKKIATIWKDLEIENLGELLYACNENRLLLYKGFGEKTQQNIKEAIEFYFASSGKFLYAQIEFFAENLATVLKDYFKEFLFEITGAFKRHLEIIEKLEWVTTCPLPLLKKFFEEKKFEAVEEKENFISFKNTENIKIDFFFCNKEKFYPHVFSTSCSEVFLNEWRNIYPDDEQKNYTTEEEIFASHHIQFIPAYLRETKKIIQQSIENKIPVVIQPQDVKAIIHSHSKWSDGQFSIEAMAKAAIERRLEYMVISDHSKSAFYANGLNEERIIAQHHEIDELNKQLHPFKIFKSIECDILNDGSLDYSNSVLQGFDVVITSIHSNLKMNEEKAMMRLLRAIENPYTSILGHLTGRLLLSRNGYPVNHEKIIGACAANHVVIELNANPVRLDIDWRWIDYALEKGVLISINPDAHSIAGFDDIKYGVLAAQKAGVTKDKNLSSFSLSEFEKFISQQQLKR